MPARRPRSRGARVHPRPWQGRPALPRSSAASRLVLATDKLGGIIGKSTSIATGMTELSHLSEAGDVRMVEVGEKPQSRRRAVARGVVWLAPATARRLRSRTNGL